MGEKGSVYGYVLYESVSCVYLCLSDEICMKTCYIV